jgi:hypothetical protein
VACQKLFAKTSVFSAHLEGKKHKNNVKKSTAADVSASGVAAGEEHVKLPMVRDP